MSPRTKEQVAQIRKKSKEQILDAALALFAGNGYHKTSISQVAARAGVSKGLIYNYFESKDDLLREIITSALEQGDDFIDDHQIDSNQPLETFDQAIDDVFKMVMENPTYWKLIMAISLKDDIINRFSDLIKKHSIKNLDHLKSLLLALNVPDSEEESLFIGAALDGILLHFIHGRDEYPLEKMKKLLKRKLRELIPE